MAAREPGGAQRSPIESELSRRAAEQETARGGTGRPPLPPLIREYAYVLLTCSFLGFWVWAGLLALGLWLLGADHRGRTAEGLLFAGWVVCWLLTFPATLLWHAPELLKRKPGPRPETAKGFVGYLLRNSRKGVFDGSLPLTLDADAPPPHFWLVGGLFTLISGGVASASGELGGAWAIACWAAFVACAASVGILVHGALGRRTARRQAARNRLENSGTVR